MVLGILLNLWYPINGLKVQELLDWGWALVCGFTALLINLLYK